MAQITIVDPVTRIEGHMKVQVTIDTVNGTQQVTDAQCTGTQFRGFEKILVGRDTKDAPYVTQRICGVCPVSHATAASLALEHAAGITVPDNARILRNLVLGANFIQSHILHFYLLAALDYITPPASAPWTPVWNIDLMRDARMQQIVSNFTTAVAMRRQAHEMAAIFAGRMPGLSAIQAGGFTTKPTSAMISNFTGHLNTLVNFINNNYVPDAQLLASIYSDYYQIGKGYGNFVAFGAFELDSTATPKRLLNRGVVYNSTPTTVYSLSTANISEMVASSWYDNSTDNLNPKAGETIPVDPATKPAAYSWLKAPRYRGHVCEAGPLARLWVNGGYRHGVSVMDRHVARALETRMLAYNMHSWLNQLSIGGSQYTAVTAPFGVSGEGLTEAPRGALGHWMSTAPATTLAPNGQAAIGSYQIITPTCWNASPKDTAGQRGPLEQALMGTPVSNAAQPIEVVRVVHSFDPCMSCSVHVMHPEGKPITVVSAQPEF
jgi:hydrogenase large subunit